MSFLTPLAFLGALLAIPIVLLYMLRLRRRELLVSSTFLWQQIIRDREANTPWQRLRRNILLLLQLLILALIVLALARPVQVVPTISAQKTVILLDASASMNATDMDDGRSRFEVARDEAERLVRESGVEDEISIIRVADVTEPLLAYTADRLAIREAIRGAQPGQGRGDWDTALTLAAAGAEGADSFRIILISDGGVGQSTQLPENIPQPLYVPVGTSSENVAITALATRALPGQPPQLFAQVQNYGAEAVEIALLIRLDGDIWDSVRQTVSGSSQRSFVFEVEEDFDTAQAQLVLDDSVTDHLEQDNVAYTTSQRIQTRRVLLVEPARNIFVEQVLRSLPDVQLFLGNANQDTLPEQPYDLYVFNNWLPAQLPDADMLIIDPPRSSELFTLGAATQDSRNLRIADRGHPLAAFLNVSGLNVLRFQPVSAAPWAAPIVTADGGALVLAGEQDGRQVVLLPFNLSETDLPLQIAWPLLMSNAMEWFSPANVLRQGTGYTVGDTVTMTPPLDASAVTVTLPDGSQRDLSLTGTALTFTETLQPGIYEIAVQTDSASVEAQPFTVNFFGTGESDITPVAEGALQLGGGVLENEPEEQLGFREFWPLVALLGLGLLLLEWYLHHQRLRIPTSVQADLRRGAAR